MDIKRKQKGEKVMNETEMVKVAIRSRSGIIWIKSQEEIRVKNLLVAIASSLKYEVYIWTVTQGLNKFDPDSEIAGSSDTKDINSAMDTFFEKSGRSLVVFLDAGPWLGNDPISFRKAKDYHQKVSSLSKDNSKQLVFVSSDDAPEISGITVINWPPPDAETLGNLLDSFLEFCSDEAREDVEKNGNRKNIIDAMLGLNTDDAANALSISLARTNKFDIQLIASEKKRVIKDSSLEWYDADPRGMDGVGGNDNLKNWLMRRKKAFSKEAREFGLPAPKGSLLLGIPGCGKSLTAKCISTAWKLPLLRLDVGSLFSKFVGESEGKVRKALQTAEAVAPCVLWIDEIEKAFGGISGGESDGGTSSRVFGTFLTWMQERKEDVFIVATSNDITKLPPEFLRSGRWDEIWFIDLPNIKERVEIIEVMKAKYKNCEKVDSKKASKASEENTGAEIEQAFIDALYKAFEKNRKVETLDVIEALNERVPLIKTMEEKLKELRDWAKGRARFASVKDVVSKKQNRIIE